MPTAPMANGPRLLFPTGDPGKSEGAAQRAYAERYFVTAERDGVPVFSGRDEENAAAFGAALASGPIPETLNIQARIGTLPEAQQGVLQGKQAAFVRSWRCALPTLQGETVISESVAVTAEPWEGNPPYTIVYRRRTDQGELAVVIQHARVDPQNGELSYDESAVPEALRRGQGRLPSPPTPRLRAVTGDQQGIDIIESVLQMITWVGFALGPQGILLAAGAGVLEVVFKMAFPPDPPTNIPKAVSDLLTQDLANDHVETNLATIVGYTQWFARQNEKAVAGDFSDTQSQIYADALADLKHYVANACDPGSALLQAISNLRNASYVSDPSYRVLGFAAFLLGASTHLLFEKCRILFSTDATSFKSPNTYDLLDAARDYEQYAEDVRKEIEDALADRLGGIVDPQEGNFTEGVGDSVAYRHYIYVQDHKAGDWPTQEVLRVSTGGSWVNGAADDVVWWKWCPPKGCSGDTPCDSNAASSWNSQYRASVLDQLQKKYNYSDDRKAKVEQAIGLLQDTINKYKAAAP